VNTRRTVTVQTIDRGPVTIEEPPWCIAAHDRPEFLVDVWHEGEEVPLLVATPCHGRVPLLTATVVQKPFATDAAVHLAVDIDGDAHELSSVQVRALANELVTLGADALQRLADRVESFEGGA
jgi:class 3 adenylate cyclase